MSTASVQPAIFWLVWGEGMTIDQAEATCVTAHPYDIMRWMKLASESWAGFERLIDRTINSQ